MPIAHIASNTAYSGETFKRLDQSGKVVRETTFSGCTFARCIFTEGAFLACRFLECIFEDCTMKLAKVEDTTFSAVTFRRCNLLGVDWTAANWSEWATKLHALVFEDCGLEYSVFLGLDLRKMQMKDCTAREANFAEADLSEADFAGTDLSGAVFLKTNLTKANFVGARNYTLSLLDNKTQGARFSLPEAIQLLHSLNIVLMDDTTQDRSAD